jgi:hypothetical protein
MQQAILRASRECLRRVPLEDRKLRLLGVRVSALTPLTATTPGAARNRANWRVMHSGGFGLA